MQYLHSAVIILMNIIRCCKKSYYYIKPDMHMLEMQAIMAAVILRTN